MVHSAFAEVAEQFRATERQGFGAQLCVSVAGEVVLDLADGIAHDAIMTVFSSSKGAAAFTMALLVDRGLLDLDAAVAQYWPEFAAADKGLITVRQLLSHQAGLPETDAGIPWAAWLTDGAAAELLAAQRPVWYPGSAFGYHAMTIGALAGELCRRVTGRSLQSYYDTELRAPGGIDLYLGLPATEQARLVELQPMPSPTADELVKHGDPAARRGGPYMGMLFQAGTLLLPASPEGRAVGFPAAGGVGSARGLATLYAATAGWGGQALVGRETLERFAQAQVVGHDVVLDTHRSHGVIFQKPTSDMSFGSHRAYGHDGAGGSMAYADPSGEIAFGYTVQRTPFPGGADPLAIELSGTIRRIVAGSGKSSSAPPRLSR
jgi:CubicO group peptidase (beta-lactamase class C family)